ncbi:hypothetical protein EVAR_51873_1 [Eumeta japonica]|uniref:Uncharacterized protein n=1 Tax=Eumeta variegata TaxID=151549 RepID=A0A4C1YMZ3_EUMVA|nr:hypothetical protein EVAR_51873_1 [Eumeta japonica]
MGPGLLQLYYIKKLISEKSTFIHNFNHSFTIITTSINIANLQTHMHTRASAPRRLNETAGVGIHFRRAVEREGNITSSPTPRRRLLSLRLTNFRSGHVVCGRCLSLLGRIGRWSGREITRYALSLARSAQGERDSKLLSTDFHSTQPQLRQIYAAFDLAKNDMHYQGKTAREIKDFILKMIIRNPHRSELLFLGHLITPKVSVPFVGGMQIKRGQAADRRTGCDRYVDRNLTKSQPLECRINKSLNKESSMAPHTFAQPSKSNICCEQPFHLPWTFQPCGRTDRITGARQDDRLTCSKQYKCIKICAETKFRRRSFKEFSDRLSIISHMGEAADISSMRHNQAAIRPKADSSSQENKIPVLCLGEHAAPPPPDVVITTSTMTWPVRLNESPFTLMWFYSGSFNSHSANKENLKVQASHSEIKRRTNDALTTHLELDDDRETLNLDGSWKTQSWTVDMKPRAGPSSRLQQDDDDWRN